jgi:hypothetical protein
MRKAAAFVEALQALEENFGMQVYSRERMPLRASLDGTSFEIGNTEGGTLPRTIGLADD